LSPRQKGDFFCITDRIIALGHGERSGIAPGQREWSGYGTVNAARVEAEPVNRKAPGRAG
jgi:hypothetical protein